MDCTISPAQRKTWHNRCSSETGLLISEATKGYLQCASQATEKHGNRPHQLSAAHLQACKEPWDDLWLCQAAGHERHRAQHPGTACLPSAL